MQTEKNKSRVIGKILLSLCLLLVMGAGIFLTMQGRAFLWLAVLAGLALLLVVIKPLRQAVLALCAAVYACLYALVSNPDHISFKARFITKLLRIVVVDWRIIDRVDFMMKLGEMTQGQASKWKVPEGYRVTRDTRNGVPIELLEKENGRTGKVIFQLHGGAYMGGMIDMYRNFALRYSKYSGDAGVVSIDYRTAPQYTFPAALDDAILAWDWLLERGYREENIVVAGDSAGGNLTLALALKLRELGRPMPGALICMSSWADLAAEGASYTTNLYKDPMFGSRKGQPINQQELDLITCYAGETDRHDPLLSPAYNSYENFPPMLIQSGGIEMLVSEHETIYEKAKAEGVDVKLTRYEGMFHVFQLLGEMTAESRAAWQEAGAYAKVYFDRLDQKAPQGEGHISSQL